MPENSRTPENPRTLENPRFVENPSAHDGAPLQRSRRPRRSSWRMVLGLVLAFLVGGLVSPGLFASAAPDDPCSPLVSTDNGVSNTELYRYDSCTHADTQSQLDRIESDLQKMQGSSPTSTPTQTPTSSPTPTSTPTPTQTPTSSPSPTRPPSGTSTLTLPTDPKFVGNSYYAQFGNAPDFARADVWPIGIFYGNFENADQAKWDVDHGINYHVEGQNTGTYPGDYTNEICFTEDELDGRNSDRNAVVQSITNDVNRCKSQGRVPYTNFTGNVTSDNGGAANLPYWKQLINIGGAVSVDGYYFTDPSCDAGANRRDGQDRAPDNAHCRSAASYGQFIDTLRDRDSAPYQPSFGFVENGASNTSNGKYITPAQLDGAVWSVVNNGGAPIYFNNSFSGGCQSSGVLRSAQLGLKDASGKDCYGAIAAQMQKTNAAVEGYARVLNSPTYTWDFKAGKTDTMLKAYGGYAWIFSGVGLDGDAGARTFTLPTELAGAGSVTDESGRSFAVVGGKFTDSTGYPTGESHHVYKVQL